MIAGRTAKSRTGGLPETGELAAVEAIDRTGLIVTSEGAFVRILRVTPPNPLLMSAQEREKTAGTFQRLISQLKAEETLQFYIDARPVNLTELLAGCRREVQASAGPAPAAIARRAIRWRWRGGGCMRRWRSRCGCTPTTRRPPRSPRTSWCRSFPARASPGRRWRGRRVGGCRPRRWSGRCRHTAARCASISRTSTLCAQSSRRRACPPACSTARRWCGCCGRG